MDITNTITHGYYKYFKDTVEFVWHREDGPADNDNQWFFHGKDVSYDVEEWFHERNISDYKDMTNEDKLALSFYMRSL